MSLPEIPILEGDYVRLEPLSNERAEELSAACEDGKLHELWYTAIPSPESMKAEIDRRIGLYTAGSMMPFATIDVATNKAIGMTTFMNMKLENFKVEIGSTWMASSYQGTAINPEAKLLMLSYAFDVLSCNAVELRTHEKNAQSRAAIEKLGAKLDGILRNDMVMANGTLRNTAVYSITKDEWPAVHDGLIARLDDFEQAEES
ncbi:GNAT family N-acetyltransferase [Aurantimicrobium sp. MWH-Uga1]|uniref:GNAT family N-acetyltransferase n=1 Tax=Aurantimicrobium sp. MWH-Uga1 TaxID=2079575 RepID=UPI000DEDF0B4|nr:GNAT family protein [Aurantimicrobium sp. MWH-Uga1]AXE55065.1 Putative ribosomal N-acetyltransferase YdaF [Aurantimicrobium sp. MWH-Uga1]